MSSLQLPSLLFLGIWIQEVDIHFAVFVLPNQREAEALDGLKWHGRWFRFQDWPMISINVKGQVHSSHVIVKEVFWKNICENSHNNMFLSKNDKIFVRLRPSSPFHLPLVLFSPEFPGREICFFPLPNQSRKGQRLISNNHRTKPKTRRYKPPSVS